LILSAHQPAYLPWLGLFHKIAISDDFVILDNVQFEKNSFTNRNKIKTPNGPLWLTVPVSISGHTENTIKDIEISNNEDWRSKHWKSLFMNYKKAPFFSKYSDFFEDLYKKEWTKLADVIEYSTDFFLKELKITTRIHKQSALKVLGKRDELLANLCGHFKADTFVFGAMGKDYADREFYAGKGIKLYFQEYTHPKYPQLWGDFAPYMSVPDLLFNVGPEKALDVIMSLNIDKDKVKELAL
jgi:hypothetical protein